MSASMSVTMLVPEPGGFGTTVGAGVEVADGGAFSHTLGAMMIAAAGPPHLAPPASAAELVLVLDGEWTVDESAEVDLDQPVSEGEAPLIDADQAVTLERGLALWAARVGRESEDPVVARPPVKPRTIDEGLADRGEVEVPDYGGTLPPEGRMEANQRGSHPKEAGVPAPGPHTDRVGEAMPGLVPVNPLGVSDAATRTSLRDHPRDHPRDRVEAPRADHALGQVPGQESVVGRDRPSDRTRPPEAPAVDQPPALPMVPSPEPSRPERARLDPAPIGRHHRRDQLDQEAGDRPSEQVSAPIPVRDQQLGVDRETQGPGLGQIPSPDRSPSASPLPGPELTFRPFGPTGPLAPAGALVDRGHREYAPVPTNPETRPAAVTGGRSGPWGHGPDRIPASEWAVDETVPATALVDRAGPAPIEIAGFSFPTLRLGQYSDDASAVAIAPPPPRPERKPVGQADPAGSLTDREFAVFGKPNVDILRIVEASLPIRGRAERPVGSPDAPIVEGVGADREPATAAPVTAERGPSAGGHERWLIPVDPATAPSASRPAPAEPVRPAPDNAPPLPTVRRDQVTIQFADEGGEVGRIRVAVNGPTVRATIIPHDPALAERLTGNLRELRRSLEERGFTEPRVTIQAPRLTEPPVGIVAARETANHVGVPEFREPTRGGSEDQRRDPSRDPWREGHPNGRDQRQRPPGRQKSPPQEERRPER